MSKYHTLSCPTVFKFIDALLTTFCPKWLFSGKIQKLWMAIYVLLLVYFNRLGRSSFKSSHGPTTPGWISAGTSWCQHIGLLPQPSRRKRNSKHRADLPSVKEENWGTGLNAYTQPMACGYICILIKKYCESVQNVLFSHIHLNVNSLQEKLLEKANWNLSREVVHATEHWNNH